MPTKKNPSTKKSAKKKAPTRKRTSTTPVTEHELDETASNAQVAKKWMVSEAAISRWSKEINIHDDEAVMDYIRNLPAQNKPKNWRHLNVHGKDKDSLDNRKKELDILDKEFKFAVLLGNYTANDDVREILLFAGNQLKAGLKKAENSLASELEGLKAADIQERLGQEFDQLLDDWTDSSSKIYLISRSGSD